MSPIERSMCPQGKTETRAREWLQFRSQGILTIWVSCPLGLR